MKLNSYQRTAIAHLGLATGYTILALFFADSRFFIMASAFGAGFSLAFALCQHALCRWHQTCQGLSASLDQLLWLQRQMDRARADIQAAVRHGAIVTPDNDDKPTIN